MANKQTAVEWFEQRIDFVFERHPFLKEPLNQAKEMEKEQILEAYKCGQIETHDTSVEYYKETYGKDEK